MSYLLYHVVVFLIFAILHPLLLFILQWDYVLQIHVFCDPSPYPGPDPYPDPEFLQTRARKAHQSC